MATDLSGNPKVVAEIQSVLRFWLDMGVDGFPPGRDQFSDHRWVQNLLHKTE
jgi:hypothetical protein